MLKGTFYHTGVKQPTDFNRYQLKLPYRVPLDHIKSLK